MDSQRFQRIEELFHEAKALEAADRASFLDQACGDDLELRAEVESLLAHCEDHTERMEVSPDGGFRAVMTHRQSAQVAIVDRPPPAERAGTRIGNYKILQEIGEGGFGSVYMAEQEQPVRRKVALKIIKLGMDTKQVIARFEAERQALAMMDHPNIAKVLEAGATESGRPYFVMELVRGISLNEYCDQNRLSAPRRLGLFMQVCGAVQHAHQKGIIHRDLKPSNVLVTLHDDLPVPKVIDFGIAKATGQRLTEKTLFTEFRQLIGTPEYMSPDQAEISGLDVDTRTDIYSLGVILYELLTGTTPFDGPTLRSKGYGEIQRIIREVDPPKPSTRMETLATSGGDTDIARRREAEPGALSRLMRGDLDWIVMKAMEKDRTRRYQSASELANDIQHYLRKEPVIAGPPSVLYKFRKFIQRHRVGVLATTVVVAALVVGLALAAVGLVQARQEAARSREIAVLLQDLFISTDPEHALAANADVESVMSRARAVFGEDHATVAATLSSRALQLQSAGDLESAERLYNESLRIWRDQYGDDNPNVGTTLTRLGVLLMTKGDDLAAEQALRESLRITTSQGGEDNLAVCETLSLLATVLANRGEFGEAESMLREALRVRRSVAPDQHLQIALTTHSLAQILSLAGNEEAIAALAMENILAWREALPAGSLLMARILAEYGLMYLDRGDLDQAEKLLREAADIFRASDEPAPQHRGLALRGLWRILTSRDQDRPKEDYLRVRLEFIDYARSVAGPDEQVLGAIISDMVAVLKKALQPVQAIPLGREVVEITRRLDDRQRFEEAVRTLGNLAWDTVRLPGRTRTEYEAALGAIEEASAELPESAPFANTLGVAQYRLGRYEEALAILARSDAWYSSQFEGGVPADIAFIAMTHHQLGHVEEARAAMDRLRAVMQQPDVAELEENQWFFNEAEAMIGAAGDESSANGR